MININDKLVTLMLSSGKTVAFSTKPKYVSRIKAAVEDSGQHDRHRLRPLNDFMPPVMRGGPDIYVCMYDVVLMSSIDVPEVQKMQRDAQQSKKIIESYLMPFKQKN